MKTPVFYRNVEARDQLELFLVAAVSSLLLLRFYLFTTDYPQIGSGSLHIAHMLYGGLLMVGSIAILLSFIGRRSERVAAFVGGVGFGVFIDELGKFITRDNNYFFRPTIGIIYAIFISLYLLFNFLSKTTKLTSVEYQLNALIQLEEAVRQDLDPREKQQIAKLLRKADQASPVTRELQSMLSRIDVVPAPVPRFLRKLLHRSDQAYRHFWQQRNSNRLIAAVFIAEAAAFLIIVLASIFNNIDDVQTYFASGPSYGESLIIGQLVSSLLVAGYAIVGAIQLPRSRANAFEQFRRATLVNLFLTEFFIFSRIQFGAIPSFTINLILLLALRYALHQENHVRVHKAQ